MGAVRNFAEILHRLTTNWAEPEFDTTYGDNELIIVWRKPLPDGTIREVWLECDTMPISREDRDTLPVPREIYFAVGINEADGRSIKTELESFTLDLVTWDGTFPAEFVACMDEHFKREESNGDN